MSLEVCRTLPLGLWQAGSSKHFRQFENQANSPKSNTEDAARLFLRRAQRPIQWKEVCQHKHEHKFLLMAPPWGRCFHMGTTPLWWRLCRWKGIVSKFLCMACENVECHAEHFDNFCRWRMRTHLLSCRKRMRGRSNASCRLFNRDVAHEITYQTLVYCMLWVASERFILFDDLTLQMFDVHGVCRWSYSIEWAFWPPNKLFHDWPKHQSPVPKVLQMIASHPALACLKGVPLVLTLASAMCLRNLICFIKHFILPMIMEHSPVVGRCWVALLSGIDRACKRNGSSNTDGFGLRRLFSRWIK